MQKLIDIAGIYFARRKVFRLFLIVLTLVFWGYSEVPDWNPISEHDLNFHAIQEINARQPANPLTFAVLGDCKNSPIFTQIVDALNRDAALQFCVINGDLVLYPTTETYQAFLDQWRSIRIPTLVVAGNHDVAFQNRYLYYSIFGRFYYALSVGDNYFIMLDDSNERSLGDEQTAWLERQLKRSQGFQRRFVFLHVPLWDPRDRKDAGIRFGHALKDPDSARRLEDLFLRYHVTTVFASHIHDYYDTAPRGLRTIITGGAGAELSGHDPKHAFYHYLRVTISKDEIRIEPVRINVKTAYSGVRKYLDTAKLYALTFTKIYVRQVVLGFFLAILILDALLEFLYRRRSARTNGKGDIAEPRNSAGERQP